MTTPPNPYPEDHWIRSHDVKTALDTYLEQQSKAYSRVKNDFIVELLGDLQGKRFLDYGCGGGAFTVHAAKSGAAVVLGVDAEESVLSTARYHARVEGVESICQFLHSSEFPVFGPHQRFDAVLLKDVIEHVEDDRTLLDRAAEALKPGGTLVVSTQNCWSLNYAIEGLYQRTIKGNRKWRGWDPTHLRFYTPMSLRARLQHSGFHDFSWRSVYIVPYKLPPLPTSRKQFLRLDALSWVDRILGRVFPYNRVGWNLIVGARTSDAVPRFIAPPDLTEVALTKPVPLTRPLVPVIRGAVPARTYR